MIKKEDLELVKSLGGDFHYVETAPFHPGGYCTVQIDNALDITVYVNGKDNYTVIVGNIPERYSLTMIGDNLKMILKEIISQFTTNVKMIVKAGEVAEKLLEDKKDIFK